LATQRTHLPRNPRKKQRVDRPTNEPALVHPPGLSTPPLETSSEELRKFPRRVLFYVSFELVLKKANRRRRGWGVWVWVVSPPRRSRGWLKRPLRASTRTHGAAWWGGLPKLGWGVFGCFWLRCSPGKRMFEACENTGASPGGSVRDSPVRRPPHPVALPPSPRLPGAASWIDAGRPLLGGPFPHRLFSLAQRGMIQVCSPARQGLVFPPGDARWVPHAVGPLGRGRKEEG